MKAVNTMRRRLLAAGIAAGALTSAPAWAELEISIIGVGANQLPIAVEAFAVEGDAPADMGEVIANDLTRTGAFRLTAPVAQQPARTREEMIAAWAKTGANALVTGKVSKTPKGWVVSYTLFDVVSGEQLDQIEGDSATAQGFRMAAHRLADRVYTRLTGEGAMFTSRLVYVSQLGRNRYQLVCADSDGENRHVIFDSKEPIISPTWSPDGRRVAYVSFERRKPIVYVQDIFTGSRQAISFFQGNNSAPAFSPDGNSIAVALSRDGLTQVYTLNANGTGVRRFTQSYGIDTEPVYSRDGSYIYFTSDRGGAPQIYRQGTASGSRAERVTFGSSYAISPDISADGRYLTYISRVDGRFRTAVLDLNTMQSTLVSATSRDESPSFSPNGRFIVYATEEKGRGVLITASVDGRLCTRIAGEGNIREPSWGPLLK